MLHEALTYLEAAYASSSYEVVVVDDGSTDATSRAALALAEQHRGKGGDNVRVVTLKRNRGKGGAVRHGMLHARGRRILFVDADGASRFEDLKLLEQEMDTLCGGSANIGEGSGMGNGHAQGGKDDGETRAIVLGSRAHMVSTEAVVKVSLRCARSALPCPALLIDLFTSLTFYPPTPAALGIAQPPDALLPHLPLCPGHPPHCRHAVRVQALYALGRFRHLSEHARRRVDFRH